MLSANQAKFVHSLQIKKYRQKYQKFLVEGDKMTVELLKQSKVQVDMVFGIERWAQENDALLKPYFHTFNIVSEAELKKISTLTTPNKVLAVASIPTEPFGFQPLANDYYFYLDGLQDPSNLGAIMRVADWFGFKGVICSPDAVDAYNPKAVQASMGATFRVPSWEMPLADILEKLPDLPVLGAVMDGQNVFETALPGHGILVIGNEGKGISSELEKCLTHRLTIPRDAAGGAESLNAAVASGILAAIFRHKQ